MWLFGRRKNKEDEARIMAEIRANSKLRDERLDEAIEKTKKLNEKLDRKDATMIFYRAIGGVRRRDGDR
jgi:hypothetical protein